MAPPPPLSVEAVLQTMADAIPTHPQGDSTSDVSSSYEVLALLVHAAFINLKFRLVGFEEDKNIEKQLAETLPRLPASWASGFGSHTFVYAHKQSSLTFIVRVDRLGAKAEIRALATGAEAIHRLERPIRDIVNSSALPLRITLGQGGAEDRSDLPARLLAVFTSAQAVAALLDDVRRELVQKLIPKLQVDGYDEDDHDAGDNAARERMAQAGRPAAEPQPPWPRPLADPFAGGVPAPPGRPGPVGDFPPPGFDDEYEMLAPPRPLRGVGPPLPSVGHSDLYPPGLGPNDPLRGAFVPGPGAQPSGMHPTFDDPIFGGGQGPGQQGFDPQVPPGARWDPVMPGGHPRFPGRGGPGGRGGGGFGGGFGAGDII